MWIFVKKMLLHKSSKPGNGLRSNINNETEWDYDIGQDIFQGRIKGSLYSFVEFRKSMERKD